MTNTGEGNPNRDLALYLRLFQWARPYCGIDLRMLPTYSAH
jgi:hypothetical protein